MFSFKRFTSSDPLENGGVLSSPVCVCWRLDSASLHQCLCFGLGEKHRQQRHSSQPDSAWSAEIQASTISRVPRVSDKEADVRRFISDRTLASGTPVQQITLRSSNGRISVGQRSLISASLLVYLVFFNQDIRMFRERQMSSDEALCLRCSLGTPSR